MSNGERVIVKLDPYYNPTGKPMPDTLLKKIKADPDFAKLSEEEQKQVISKIENMIKDVEDVDKYGTLKEKLIKYAELKNFFINKDGKIPFVSLDRNLYNNVDGLEYKYLVEGRTVSAGASVLFLMAFDSEDDEPIMLFGTHPSKIIDIKAPITGRVFSLCEMTDKCKRVNWNDDLFIVSSIPNDTRSAVIKWYKESTGKQQQYKTPEDIHEEAAEYAEKNDKVLVPDGKLKENFDLIKELAENGNGTAMYLLSQYFLVGAHNREKFKEWLKKAVVAGEILAKIRWHSEYERDKEIDKDLLEKVLNIAEDGNIYANFELGKYYDINRNYEKSAKYHRRAAEQGYQLSQVNLGNMYEHGKGVVIDYKEAAKWFRKAAEQGNNLGQFNLGLYYFQGRIVKDYKEAAKWFRKAAEQGYAKAQYAIGVSCYNGVGVERDYREAAKWLRLAAKQGDREAEDFLYKVFR